MIIRAQVTYTRELLLKWAKFNLVKRINQIITYIFAEAMMLVIVGAVIFLAVISASSMAILVAIGFTIALPFLLPLYLWWQPRSLVQKFKYAFGTKIYYELHDNQVVLPGLLAYPDNLTAVSYSLFKTVYETKDMFYLYTSNLQAYILPKSAVFEGTPNDLAAMLRSRVGEQRYRVR